MSSESEWEPPPAEDSDSDYRPEPPPKRRKLTKKTKKSRKKASKARTKTLANKRKKKIKKSIRKSATTPVAPKRSRRRKVRNPKPQQCPPLPDSDVDIEILESRLSKRKSSKSAKKTKSKRKIIKRSKTKTTKSRQSKKSKALNQFKPCINRVVNIPNFDTLICGMFRKSLIKTAKKKVSSLPRDVTNLVDEYQRNILYFQVDFVWTHKYACCTRYAQCKRLKSNRGQYDWIRDPTNEFDCNAIKIMTATGERVGHIPRGQASTLAPLMDEGKIYLKSVGGLKAYPCREIVEIVPLETLSSSEIERLRWSLPLEQAHFDQNRYVTALYRSLTV